MSLAALQPPTHHHVESLVAKMMCLLSSAYTDVEDLHFSPRVDLSN